MICPNCKSCDIKVVTLFSSVEEVCSFCSQVNFINGKLASTSYETVKSLPKGVPGQILIRKGDSYSWGPSSVGSIEFVNVDIVI